MLGRLDAVEQRGQQQRAAETRVAAASAAPGPELAVAVGGRDRRAHGDPTLGVRVEEEA